MPLELLLRFVWAMRVRVALAALLLVAAGAGLILLWPRAHVAEAVVAPAETTSVAVSSLLAPAPFATGGLLDPRPSGNFAVYLGALRSAEAATMLAAETPLLAMLAARKASGVGGMVRAALGLPAATVDLDDARAWLERGLSVTQSLASVTWTIEIAHPDREAALDVLRRLHAFAEAKVRDDLADLSRRRVAALERRLAEERDVFLRQALYDLLAQQQRIGLVVAADEAVAARLVSAPSVELNPSLPNRPLLLLLLIAAPGAAIAGAAFVALLRGPPSRTGYALGGVTPWAPPPTLPARPRAEKTPSGLGGC